ncbi:MAG: beta-lactamase protein [Dehalococcoidia bacterium]|nr:beta-lactamase protein [Dehalococcoidia bacterium]
MRQGLRYVALLIAVVFLLTGCPPVAAPAASPAPPPQTIPSQPTPPQPSPPPAGAPGTGVGTLQVHFIDVGQGDSILIQAPDGKTMLIDGSEANSAALEYLKSKGINHLDLVVATHPHADHIGGLVQVLKAIPVAKVITSGQPTTTKTYENFLDAIAAAKAEYVEVKRGDTVRLGYLTFSVLHPISSEGDDLNNGSVVLHLEYGQVSFLFTGDAEKEAEGSVSVSSVSPVKAMILKVGHHGSRTASSRAFLALVEPEVAIYSAGKGNNYGHPHPEAIAALKAAGARIYGTDVNGTVIVTTDGKTYSVAAARGGSLALLPEAPGPLLAGLVGAGASRGRP